MTASPESRWSLPRSAPHALAVVALLLAFILGPAPLPAQAPLFTEQTASAGLGGVTFIPGTYSHSNYTGPVACGDFDRDGDQDLFVPTGGAVAIPDKLFINDGNGTFTDQAAAWGLTAVHKGKGVAVADYDGDGWLDIYVTSAGSNTLGTPGQHRLYRNSGTGSLTNVAVAAGVNQTTTSSEDGFGCCFGDYDLDGDLDLFVAGFASGNTGSRLFRNDGDGTFTDVTVAIGLFAGLPSSSGFAPRFQDMNGDRYPELLFVADFGTSRYFKNDGDGTFTEMSGAAGTAQEENGMGQTAGDYDNDGDIDWYVTSIYIPQPNPWTGNKLYLNQGNHSYVEVAGTAGCDDGGYGWAALSIDVDNDRFVDILETNGDGGQWSGEQSYFWRNLGTGSYSELAIPSGLVHYGAGRGMLAFDYDGDGDQDVVIAGNNEAIRLYRNDTAPAGRHWLRVFLDTDGAPGIAPDGIGARVRITTPSGQLTRWIDAGDNFLSKSELSAHFGLGLDATISELRVTWPDGVETLLADVAPDQTLVVHRAPPGPSYIRGDANADGLLDISDPVSILSALFGGGAYPCEAGAEVNGDTQVDIADPVYLLAHLFAGGAGPPPPFPGCGPVPGGTPCTVAWCP